MKIRTYELDRFMEFLMEFELNGKDSRLRTRFVRLLNEYVNRFSEEHHDLILRFAEKDDAGEPNIIEKDGIKQYDVKDVVGFNKEYFNLRNELLLIEETEERKEMFNLIKEIILNCEKTFKGEEAFVYDRYCEIAETISD